MLVLDASALLAASLGELGGERVEAVIPRSCISAVNLAEVMARLQRDGADLSIYLQELGQTGLEIVPFDLEQAALTAGLLPRTRPYGLSLGDRACLALAIGRGLPIVTADRVWAELGLPVDVRLIR